MDYTIELRDDIRHRFIAHAKLNNFDSSRQSPKVLTLLDTGAFNSMIDIGLAKTFATLLPITIPISIGGNLGEAHGCIIHKVTLGNFEMKRVFAMAFPFKDWLMRHIILGANVLNNWEFVLSKANNVVKLSERVPHDAPNKKHPYQNYFIKGEYVAIQDEILGDSI